MCIDIDELLVVDGKKYIKIKINLREDAKCHFLNKAFLVLEKVCFVLNLKNISTLMET